MPLCTLGGLRPGCRVRCATTHPRTLAFLSGTSPELKALIDVARSSVAAAVEDPDRMRRELDRRAAGLAARQERAQEAMIDAQDALRDAEAAFAHAKEELREVTVELGQIQFLTSTLAGLRDRSDDTAGEPRPSEPVAGAGTLHVPSAARTPPVLSSSEDPTGIKRAVLEILYASQTPMAPREVARALQSRGIDRTDPIKAGKLLTRMMKAGRVERSPDGGYGPPKFSREAQ